MGNDVVQLAGDSQPLLACLPARSFGSGAPFLDDVGAPHSNQLADGEDRKSPRQHAEGPAPRERVVVERDSHQARQHDAEANRGPSCDPVAERDVDHDGDQERREHGSERIAAG